MRSTRALVLGSTLAGTLAGALAGSRLDAAFLPPGGPDPERWVVIVPGMDEGMVPEPGRGTQVAGGVLSIVPHAFNRANRLLPRNTQHFATLSLQLREDSGPAHVVFMGGSGKIQAQLEVSPKTWRSLPQGSPRPLEGPLVVSRHHQALWVGEQLLGPEATEVEITATAEPVRLQTVRLEDEAGRALVDEDWRATTAGGRPLGAALGALLGLALGVAAAEAAGPLGLLAALAPGLLPVLALSVDSSRWLALAERLFLSGIAPWRLAAATLGAAMLPALASALLASGALEAPRPSTRAPRLWAGAALFAGLLASRGLEGAALLWALPGLALLLLMPFTARRSGTDPDRGMIQDLPALAAVAILGWGPGLLVAGLWRLLVLAAWAPTLLARSPRAGADALLISVLALPFCGEAAVRATRLERAWDADRVAGATLGSGDKVGRVDPFWSASCGASPQVIWWMGGSSAGGAYQLGDEREAFFAGQVHASLCAQGLATASVNLAGSGRDTFTFSRGIDALLAEGAPALVVLYAGVNDLLTTHSSQSRKEREALAAERAATLEGLRGLSSRSRLLVGLGLLRREEPAPEQGVVAIPVADARENMLRIADALAAHGSRLLLVPELASSAVTPKLEEYRRMEASLPDAHPGILWFDLAGAVGPRVDQGMLVDRNHLSRSGHQEVAALLTPVIAAALPPQGAR